MKKHVLFPIILSLAGCSDLARVAYYNTAYEALNPKLWNDNIVITGSKPKDLHIYGEILFQSCEKYKSSRKYEYTAQDFGTTYKITLPVINNHNNNCLKSNVVEIIGKIDSKTYSIWGFWRLGSNWAEKKTSQEIVNPLEVTCEKERCDISGYESRLITYSTKYINKLNTINMNITIQDD